MAKMKGKIHPLLRVALAAVVWTLASVLLEVGVGCVKNMRIMDDWLVVLAAHVLGYALLLLVMRFLVFFTRAAFSKTTLPMLVGMELFTVVRQIVRYCMEAWALQDVALLFLTDSLPVAVALYLASVLTAGLTWILCARSARGKQDYFVPVLLGVIGAVLSIRVYVKSQNVLIEKLWTLVGFDAASPIVEKIVPSVILFVFMLLSQWLILYKGQLDTLFGGRTVGKAGGPVGKAGGSSIVETDLTREFEAAMRESGGSSRTTALLRGASRDFE